MKFSIIMPVYNVEPYLAECLDSILKQSYTDYEVISTDASLDLLLEYAEKNTKIKIINSEINKGGFL